MNPLDHHSPEALFGEEALKSERGLKRAYAKLIRRHKPESDPEAFAHIHRLYEQARAALSGGPQPQRPTRPEPAANEDAEAQDSSGSRKSGAPDPVEAAVALLREERWEEGLDALNALAMDAVPGAGETMLLLLEASAPERSLPWLVELAEAGQAPAASLLSMSLINHDPPLAGAPELDAIGALLNTPDAIRRHAERRAFRLLDLGQDVRAVEILEEALRRVPALAGVDGRALADQLLARARGGLRGEAVQRAARLLDDAGLDLDVDTYARRRESLYVAEHVDASRADASLPDALFFLVNPPVGPPLPIHAWLLLDLKEEAQELDRLDAHLSAQHPTLRRVLVERAQGVVFEPQGLRDWPVGAEPPPSPQVNEALLLALLDAELERPSDAASTVHVAPLLALASLALMILGVYVFPIALLAGLAALGVAISEHSKLAPGGRFSTEALGGPWAFPVLVIAASLLLAGLGVAETSIVGGLVLLAALLTVESAVHAGTFGAAPPPPQGSRQRGLLRAQGVLFWQQSGPFEASIFLAWLIGVMGWQSGEHTNLWLLVFLGVCYLGRRMLGQRLQHRALPMSAAWAFLSGAFILSFVLFEREILAAQWVTLGIGMVLDLLRRGWRAREEVPQRRGPMDAFTPEQRRAALTRTLGGAGLGLWQLAAAARRAGRAELYPWLEAALAAPLHDLRALSPEHVRLPSHLRRSLDD